MYISHHVHYVSISDIQNPQRGGGAEGGEDSETVTLRSVLLCRWKF